METIANLIADRENWWQPSEPDEQAVNATLQARGVAYLGWPEWLRIDARERNLGEQVGRERIKLYVREQMIEIGKDSK